MDEINEQEQAVGDATKATWTTACRMYRLKDIDMEVRLCSPEQIREHHRRHSKRGIAPVALAMYMHSTRHAIILFNREAIRQDFEHVLHKVVPHELAHIVCMAKGVGNKHCTSWQEVCIRLGGDGAAEYEPGHFDLRLVKSPIYKYSLAGREVKVSAKRHKLIQEGARYKDRHGNVLSKEHYNGVYST